MADTETIRPKYGELLTAHEAFELTFELRACVDNDITFAQTLIRYLTWEDLCVLQLLIRCEHELRVAPSSANEEEQRNYLIAVRSAVLRAKRWTIKKMSPDVKHERLVKIKNRAISHAQGNERKWSPT